MNRGSKKARLIGTCISYPSGEPTQPEAMRISTEEALAMCLRGLKRAGVDAYAIDLHKTRVRDPGCCGSLLPV